MSMNSSFSAGVLSLLLVALRALRRLFQVWHQPLVEYPQQTSSLQWQGVF